MEKSLNRCINSHAPLLYLESVKTNFGLMYVIYSLRFKINLHGKNDIINIFLD